MRAFLFYGLCGLISVFLQSSVFPLFLVPDLRPNPLLILAVFAGLKEDLYDAMMAALLIGALQDSFSGHSLGLHVTVYLLLTLCALALSEHFNADSSPLLMLLVAAASLLQNLLVATLLVLLADSKQALHILLPAAPVQIVVNLIFAMLLLTLLLRVRHWFGYRNGLAGMIYQSKQHGP